jgi:hypothetical protein
MSMAQVFDRQTERTQSKHWAGVREHLAGSEKSLVEEPAALQHAGQA